MRRVFVLSVGVAAAAVMVFVSIGATAAVGAWSIVATPDAAGATASHLERVACVTTSDCWAAGFSESPAFATLMEHWNGTAWTVVTTPDPGPPDQLNSVACASATECWAVGSQADQQQTLIEEWDGSAWAAVSAPSPTASQLTGVACVSTTDCWAVGFQNGNHATLIEHWDGTAWTTTKSPNSGTPTNVLQSVACASATECWAVGTQTDTTFIEKWDGTAWTLVANTPNNTSSGIVYNDLFDVTCASVSLCWAVGESLDVNSSGLTLALRWDGSAWSLATTPNATGTGAAGSYLDGVACMSTSECWAVGAGGGPTSGTLVEKWDGSAWSIVSSPNPAGATIGDELLGATCDAGTCWGVGDNFVSNTAADTLAEEYTAPAVATPTPTPTASPTPTPTPTASPGAGRISVPSAGAPPGDASTGAPVLLLATGAGAGIAAEGIRRRRRR